MQVRFTMAVSPFVSGLCIIGGSLDRILSFLDLVLNQWTNVTCGFLVV